MAEATLVGPDVRAAQRLTELLDARGYPPRAVLWVYAPEGDSWRLWIVPSPDLSDKRQFYLEVAKIFSAHSTEFQGMDLGEVQFVKLDHPAVVGLGAFMKVDGVGSVRSSSNMLNGYFLPDAIIVRLSL